MPNLEQCGLLIVDYDDLDTIASDDQTWKNRNPVLLNANSETREKVLRVLMDLMRRVDGRRCFLFQGNKPSENEKAVGKINRTLDFW